MKIRVSKLNIYFTGKRKTVIKDKTDKIPKNTPRVFERLGLIFLKNLKYKFF